MYSISGYGRMIADSARMDAYVRALRQAIRPDTVVLDIGTGLGIFAILACRSGARRVYALEPDHAIQLAREIAAANGCAERVHFIQKLSTQATLPERAGVIISDLRGVLPWFQHHIPSIVDARRRLLAPGGVLIPRSDSLWGSPVEAPELYKDFTGAWDDNRYGLNMEDARRVVTNTWHKAKVSPEQLLAEPKCWAVLDYRMVEDPDISADITWNAKRAGTAHGLSIWFDSVLAEDVHFSNAPGAPELIYGSAFFPLSRPVSLSVGDDVSVSLRADLVDDDYIWSWHTRVTERGSDRVKAKFDQSTFFGAPLSTEGLRKQAADYTPRLNEDGQIDHFILTLINREITLDEIARRVSDRFHTRFVKWYDALTRVCELSKKYSR